MNVKESMKQTEGTNIKINLNKKETIENKPRHEMTRTNENTETPSLQNQEIGNPKQKPKDNNRDGIVKKGKREKPKDWVDLVNSMTVPRTINDSQIEKIYEIGRGAFGTVWYCTRSNKPCAVKTITTSQSMVPSQFQMISNEVNILANIKGQFIINFFGYYFDNTSVNIVMEYFEGSNLSTELHKINNDYLISDISLQIVTGLNDLHKFDVMHLDLKPENILINSDLQIKLTDFGLSQTIHSSSEKKFRGGTLKYMSPEQLKRGKILTTKSDIFSFGRVLYALCTKQDPFFQLNMDEIVDVVVKQNAKPEYQEDTLDRFKIIMDSCFEFEPENRISTEDLYNAIKQLNEELDI